MGSIRILKPGMLTTVQDRGRWGWQSRGVPVAGPMDPCSHRLANALVGNDPGAATLEVTLVGPEIEFSEERLVAVAGAEFRLAADGRAVAPNAAFLVPASARLRFGPRTKGARAYVGISGGITVPPALDSRATHLISRMGGIDGRALQMGDELPLGDPARRRRSRTVTSALVSSSAPLGRPHSGRRIGLPSLPEGHADLRVLPGPDDEYFAANALEILQSAPYTISQASDRMGYRLQGPILPHSGNADIISDVTPLGVLQVPASGQPILLMADRQTSGGYPRLGTVIAADLGVAGQLVPGDTISFRVCARREALAALIAQERAMMALESPGEEIDARVR